MSQWPAVGFTDFAAQMAVVFQSQSAQDAVTMATPLDALRTQLHVPEARATVAGILGSHASFGNIGGKGWEWIALAYLAGGLWLLQQRIITWHVPVAFLGVLALIAGGFSLGNPDRYAGPVFHIVTGGAMLGAFFILTDPVSGATTPRGKLIFAAGAALLTWIIRSFGAYPDGMAFGVLLMNLCVPLIDMGTQPPVFGHKGAAAGEAMEPRTANNRHPLPEGPWRAECRPRLPAHRRHPDGVHPACSPRSWRSTYKATKPAIDASAEAEKLKLVNEVLPAALYDNALLADWVDVAPRTPSSASPPRTSRCACSARARPARRRPWSSRRWRRTATAAASA
jgi:hypothetical protein